MVFSIIVEGGCAERVFTGSIPIFIDSQRDVLCASGAPIRQHQAKPKPYTICNKPIANTSFSATLPGVVHVIES